MRRARKGWLLGVVVTGVLTVGVVAAALTGSTRVAVALSGLLLGLGVLLVVDTRTRTADLAHLLRLAAVRQAEQSLGAGAGQDITRALGADGVLEQMERRLVGAVETERLRAADRHQEVLAQIAELAVVERGPTSPEA